MFLARVTAKLNHLRLTTPEEDLAHRLKAGDRVVMVKMDNDPRPIAPGTQGTVERVNWIHRDRGEAQVMVSWDTGRSLMVLVPEDRIELVGSFLRVEARPQLKPGDRVVMVKAPRPVQPGTKGTVKRADHGVVLVDWGGGHEVALAPDDRVELVARTEVRATHLDQTERQLASLQGQLRQVSRIVDSVNAKQGVGSGKVDETMDDKIDTLIAALRRKLNRGNRS
jgi:hypothetical protein